MTARILRIELRRSVAVWAAALSLPLGFLWPQVYAGMAVVMGQHRGELIFLVPLALGLGASQARRDRRSRTTELLATTARPSWQRRLHTAAALGLGSVTGYVVVLAGLAVYAAIAGAYFPLPVVASAVVIALTLAAAVWLGLAVGRLAPWVLVPPLAVVAGFVAMLIVFVVTDTERFTDGTPPATGLLYPANSEGFGDGFDTLTAPASVAQGSWAAAIAAACLILCVAARHFRVAAVVPVALGAVLAVTLLPHSLDDALTLDRGALALVCTLDEQVCARRIHPLVLDDLREPGRQTLSILSAKLPQAPTQVVEGYFGDDLPVELGARASTVFAEVSVQATGHVEGTERDLLWTLLMGAGTMPCPDVPGAFGPRYNAARLIAASWLLEEEPPLPTDPTDPAQPGPNITRPAYQELLSLPPEDQRARVAALREAELACAPGDRLDILVGSGEP